ncbi:hypothetical protein ABH935_009891 [Catenulispora sp. GAS73]|jgi:hypothetical protein|uniref:hypothetical protein n=1 Tax=Catenulispora sp. GAS73 TaxID=3156269 RepID=UPI003519A402
MALITVHLKRTVDAVRAALPEDELAEFDADMASTTDDEPQRTFERWFARAVLNEAGLLADIKAGISHATGKGIPVDEAFPGLRERWERERAQRAA